MSSIEEHKAAAARFKEIVKLNPAAMQSVQKISATLATEIVGVNDDKSVNVKFDVPDTFSNAFGRVQGGAVATMIDEAAAYAATSIVGAHCFLGTIEIETKILNPFKIGKVAGIGRIVKESTKALFASVELESNNQIVAIGSAIILIDFSRPVRASWTNG